MVGMNDKRTCIVLHTSDQKAIADLQRLTGITSVISVIRLALREAVWARMGK